MHVNRVQQDLTTALEGGDSFVGNGLLKLPETLSHNWFDSLPQPSYLGCGPAMNRFWFRIARPPRHPTAP